MRVGHGVCGTGRTYKFGQRTLMGAVLTAAFSMVSLQAGAQATAPSTKAANTVTMHFDPAATTIRFTLKSMLHNAQGTFKLKGGDVVTNPANGLAQGEVLIDAASASTGDAARDAKWQREVLDSATYPAIIFHPVKVEGLKPGDGTQDAKASGTLTLKGQDHPVEMSLRITTSGKDVTVSTHFTIPYVQWGLKEATAGMMHYDKQVEMNVVARGTLKNETAVPSAPPAADSQ
jgi:polyisoprenoid-binding protein YceI